MLSVGCRTEQQRLFPVQDQFSAENKTRTTIVSTSGLVIFRERSDAQFSLTQSRLDMIFSKNFNRRGIATVSTSSWPVESVCFRLFMASQSVSTSSWPVESVCYHLFMASRVSLFSPLHGQSSQSVSTASWPVSLFPPLHGQSVCFHLFMASQSSAENSTRTAINCSIIYF